MLRGLLLLVLKVLLQRAPDRVRSRGAENGNYIHSIIYSYLVAEWIHFTLFGIILPTIKRKVYTLGGLFTQQLSTNSLADNHPLSINLQALLLGTALGHFTFSLIGLKRGSFKGSFKGLGNKGP